MSRTATVIRRSTKDDAHTPEIVGRLVNIINEAYRWSEAEQWTREKERTNAAEIAELLSAGSMLLAFIGETIVGVVKIEQKDRDMGGFGMLATDPDGLGQGTGRALVAEAETWGREMNLSAMEIEIVRAEQPNDHKRFLHEWYTRLGYVEQATYPIAERIPEIAPLQRQTCVSTVYRKSLK